MKKLRNILIALGVGIVASLASCTNLDETPYDFLTDSTLDFTNEQTIAELSGNVYSYLRKTYWTYYGMWDWNEDASDLHFFPSRIGVGWGDYYISYHKHQFNPEIESINYVIWYHSYVGIMYANQCLSNQTFLEAMPEKVSEIRALRAFFYYILFDSYRNIMILPEGQQEQGYLPTQVEPQVAFDWIVNELKVAEADLPDDGAFDAPTKAMAWMTLAKMHLNYYAWFQDSVPYKETATTEYSGAQGGQVSHYEEALYWLDKVIKSPNYNLAANYLDNHKQDISGSPEIIFGINLDPTQATGCYLGPACLPQQGAAAFGVSAGWNGGCAVPQFIDTYMHEVNYNKIDAKGYPTVTYKDKRFYDTWAYGKQTQYGTGGDVSLYGDCDAEGLTQVYYTKEVHSIDNPGAYMFEGYRYKKTEIVAGSASTYGDDAPVYRLADAYYMAAECALRLGGSKLIAEYSENKAAELVTAVRVRAFDDVKDATRTVSDLKGASVYDYGVRDFTYKRGYFRQGFVRDKGKEVLLYGEPVKDAEGKIVYMDSLDVYGNEIPYAERKYAATVNTGTAKTDYPAWVVCQNFTYEDFEGNTKLPVAKNHPDMIWTEEGGADIELGGLLDDLAWEFVGEYHRRQDLIRFRTGNGTGNNVWNAKSWFCKRAETDPNDYHKNLYPISQDNMESNIALVQNPGYPQRGEATAE